MGLATKTILLLISLGFIWFSVFGVVATTVSLNQMAFLAALCGSVVGLVGLTFSVTTLLFQ
jgi:hypothetical protein